MRTVKAEDEKKGNKMNVNKVMLMGRLTADVELQHTQNNMAVVRFTIAVNRPKQKDRDSVSDFIECVAFDKKAEFIAKYFAKGSPMILFGSIRTGSYTDKEGNKRKTWTVFTSEVQFAWNAKRSQNDSRSFEESDTDSSRYKSDTQKNENDGYFDNMTNIEEDFPF